MRDVTPMMFTGADGNALAADRHGGGGQPVLLLHGGGQTRHAWARTARAIEAAGLQGFAVDQRGHGDSAWVEDGAYAFEDFGRDAERVADEIARLCGRRPVLVGASLGGIAGLCVAARRRDPPFAGLVLVDVTPSLNLEGLIKIRTFMSARMAEGFASVEEAAEAVALYLPGRAKPASVEGLRRNLRLRPDGRYRWHWDPAFIAGPRSVMGDGEAISESRRAAALNLDVPMLLVRGERSDLVTQAEVAEFRALAPQADYVDIAGAGHMVVGDRNDAFSDAILAFLLSRDFDAGRGEAGRAAAGS